MNKEDYAKQLDLNEQYFLYNLVFCSEYVRAGFFKRVSANNSKYIGDLTCLNSPSEDGANPHWKVFLEVLENENKSRVISKSLLTKITDFLCENGYISKPIWVEGREFITKEGFDLGELWNDE
jgi:hypothetical protein